MEYILLTASFAGKLSEMVSKKLAEGWELYGNPCSWVIYSPHSGKTENYGQAVIRKTEGQ